MPQCWYCFNEFAQNLVITIVTYRRKISISPQEKEKSLSVTKGERGGKHNRVKGVKIRSNIVVSKIFKREDAENVFKKDAALQC